MSIQYQAIEQKGPNVISLHGEEVNRVNSLKIIGIV